MLQPISTNTDKLRAKAHAGEVVIFCNGPKPVEAAFTPEAVLDSLDDLRAAAERAIKQRHAGKR